MLSQTRRAVSIAIALLITVLPAQTAQAGNNAGGRAYLSWDRAGAIYTRGAVPTAGAPLYLHLQNAPDVHQLAATIRWTTDQEVDTPPCYALVSSTAPVADTPADSLCGWAVDVSPAQPFQGDTGYTWSILFPPGGVGRDCVRYTVTAAACDSAKHAVFLASRVVVMDSAGLLDTLLNVNYVTVEPPVGPPLALHAVYPQVLTEGQPTLIGIDGAGLASEARVFLQQGGQRIEAQQVELLESTHASARVEAAFGSEGPIDLVVSRESGSEVSLAGAFRGTRSPLASGGQEFYKPTNAAFACKDVDLYGVGRVKSEEALVIDHISHPEWPVFLHSAKLRIIRSSGDTVAVMLSRPYDGVGFETSTNNDLAPGRIVLPVQPPAYASSVATLVTTGLTFRDATGEFADAGKPILAVTVTYVDGDSSVFVYTIGGEVRNWTSGRSFCASAFRPWYDLRPTSPLVAQVYGGSAADSVYYDLQEIRLEPTKLNKRIKSIALAGVKQVHSPCVYTLLSTSGLFGLATWPNFKIVNAQGDSLVRQSQFTGELHGGFAFGASVVGTRRTTDQTACQVTCMAMNYAFLGLPCSVHDLNAYLQQNRGYAPDCAAYVSWVSPGSDTILLSGPARSDTKSWKPGDTFVVERPGPRYTNPIATYQIIEGVPRKARRIAIHDVSHSASVGDSGWVYWNMLPEKADRFTNGSAGVPRLRSITISGEKAQAMLPVIAESLLVNGVPVQLNTHGHFVIADGWVPSFRPDSTAKGTYAIKDPYDRRNFTRLLQSSQRGNYGNEFRLIRYVVNTGATQPQGVSTESSLSTAPSTAGLSIVVSHATNVAVTDPLGRNIWRDPSTGLYASEIPDAWVLGDVVANHDTDDQLDGPPMGVTVHVPGAVDGHYVVRIDSEGDMSVSSHVFDSSGVRSTATAMDTSMTVGGNTYDVTYTASEQRVAIAWVGAVSVGSPVQGAQMLRVLNNPAIGSVRFWIQSEDSYREDRLEIFDLAGRKVDEVPVAPSLAGGMEVLWDWRAIDSRTGIYFARVASRPQTKVRFAVVR